ncbi:MAG: hypothetical protein WCK26_00510 [Candidatus Saccharibacteria bacterium]
MNQKNKGFTLIELMLAMGFVSALLLAIAMTVIQIGNIYNRGITYKNVNQVGGSIANELQRSIDSSSPFNVTPNGTNYIDKPWGGRLCTGNYSYIWNNGSALSPTLNTDRNIYKTSTNEINFVKIYDSQSTYCANPLQKIDEVNAIELIDPGQYDLAIHGFSITSSTTADDPNSGQRLYTVQFTLGTNNQNALFMDTLDGKVKCKPPSDPNSDPQYCSTNGFTIVARAGNEVIQND